MRGVKKKIYRYDNGLPFNTLLAKNLDSLKERIRIGKASMVIVDGGLGEGKTTMAVHVADYFQGKPIDVKEQYGMGGLSFQEKLEICYIKKHPVVIYDEAGDFNKRGALTYFNKQLSRIFETYRAFKILVVLVIPNMGLLDSTLFYNKIPQLLINCYNRLENYGNYRAYSLYRMYYIMEYMSRAVVKQKAYGKVRSNFKGQFLDLTPKRSKLLENLSKEGKKEIVTKATLSAQGFVNIKYIATKLNRGIEWVRLKINERGIQPVKKVKKAFYYDKEVLQILSEDLLGKGN